MTRELEAYYDKIDRFLRDNLDDHDYADYSEALEALWAAQLAYQLRLAERVELWTDIDGNVYANDANDCEVQLMTHKPAPMAASIAAMK